MKNIWSVPAYLPYVHPDLTEEMIAEAEAKLGYRLPASFLSLLREQNGGYIRYSLEDLLHQRIDGIGEGFPSLTDFDWSEAQECVGFELKGLVPFDGDGHWHLCLDYRVNPAEPSVSYVDIECDSEKEIAPSFDGYLELLEIEVEDRDFYLSGVADITRLLAALGPEMGVAFEPPSTFNHGYQEFRGRGEGAGSEWIWVSPNGVPRGFVRENDPRYEALRDRLPGEALRYPELPPSSWLLTVTDGLHRSLLDACRALALDLRPLSQGIAR